MLHFVVIMSFFFLTVVKYIQHKITILTTIKCINKMQLTLLTPTNVQLCNVKYFHFVMQTIFKTSIILQK